MKTTTTGRSSRYGSCVAALCVTLTLTAHGGEPLALQLHGLDVPGVRDIQAGRYAQGVQRLEARLAAAGYSASRRAPALIALCAGYALMYRLDAAARACDDAIRTGRDTNLAYNNRAVVNMLRGRYDAAVRDFERALHRNARDRIARSNKRIATERVAAIRWQREQALAAGNSDIQDVSTATLRPAGR